MSRATLAPRHLRQTDLAERGDRAGWRDVAVVLAPAAAALVIAVVEISSRSIWIDEAASVTIAAQHGSALWAAIAHDGGSMLGYYLLLHVLDLALGNGPLVMRLPSALATAAGAGILAEIGRRCVNRRAALATGLLAAVSLPLVNWGQNARGYAPMVAFIEASWLALVVALGAPARSRRARRAWVAYAACTALAMYMTFVAALVVPAQLVLLIRHRRRAREMLLSLVAAAVASAPIAVLAVRRGTGQLFWVPRPDSAELVQILKTLSSSSLPPSYPQTATSDALLVLTGAAALAAAGLVLSSKARAGMPEVWLVALSWLAVPFLADLAESLVGQSIFESRELLLSVPAVTLLLGAGLADRRLPSALGSGALGTLVVLRMLQVVPTYGMSPENWHAAISYVLSHSTGADCVAFYPSDGRMAFKYYMGPPSSRTDPRPVLPSAPWTTDRAYVERYVTFGARELARVASSCPRLWLVSSHVGSASGPPGSVANYQRYLALQTSLARAYGPGRTVAFGWSAPVDVELFAR